MTNSTDGIPFDQRPEDGRGGRIVPLRLQKFLARAGVASRRASENLITAGRVSVNGAVVSELGTKVDPLVDVVCVDGREVRFGAAPITIMLNKPAGVVTTMKAQSARPIVADLVPTDRYPGLYPIGRLDADTTGLLLFSTDGELGNGLLHPSRHVSKTYRALLDRPLSATGADALRAGVQLDDGPAQPATVAVAGKGGRLVRITVHEGRYHQVKRMFEAVGRHVVRLHRESFGPLSLGNLASGAWRVLSDDELAALHSSMRPDVLE
ncbi:MAG TPA: rRNA pseudouridine synthase [Eggerthellaceae bacterium]|nr:rRNA pseudouridine synthase [Eggerthellaceae bacterium]